MTRNHTRVKVEQAARRVADDKTDRLVLEVLCVDSDRSAAEDKLDVWGELPLALRAQMNAYAGQREFMAKHETLIRKYYRSISEQSRRKGD